MTEQHLIDLIEAINENTRQIRIDMARIARNSYRQDLEMVANTPARQEIWRLCDGVLSNEEIARRIGITIRAVQYFIQDAEKKGLIIAQRRGYPKRNESFDEIPAEWKPYKKSEDLIITNETKTGGNPNE